MIDVITPVIALTQPENFDAIIALYVGVLLMALFAFLVLFLVAIYK